MPLRIQIKDNTVEIKRGNGARGAYEIHEQTGYLVTSDEVRKLTIPLRKGQTPYAAGDYVLADESFKVNDFGGLQIGRLQLLPVNRAKVA